jgi:predicted kinase
MAAALAAIKAILAGNIAFYMSSPLICYVLIGLPGSGKSTLAAQMLARQPRYRVISTDQIRQELYGNSATQGNWSDIEAQVFAQIEATLQNGYPVIYDATNFKHTHRIDLLQKLSKFSNIAWVAWYLQTPLEQCKERNRQRDRQVPEPIIETIAYSLATHPPSIEEGFAQVHFINGDLPLPLEVLDGVNRSKNIGKLLL